MKTIIIATLLSVGVLLRPEMAPVAHDTGVCDNITSTVSVGQIGANAQAIPINDMEAIRGAGVVECYQYFDEDLDVHDICCINLWIFKFCGDVNISAVKRLIESII